MAQSRKVLIVEDEEILAENLLVHLRRRGWEACLAATGREAVAVAADFRPRVLLLDYHLPDMDGFQTLAAIRAGQGSFGCILMTGHPTDAVLGGAHRHGIRHLLAKPFALADLDLTLADEGSPANDTSRGRMRG